MLGGGRLVEVKLWNDSIFLLSTSHTSCLSYLFSPLYKFDKDLFQKMSNNNNHDDPPLLTASDTSSANSEEDSEADNGYK